MLYALIAVHAILGAFTPLMVKKLGARVFYVLSIAPLAAAIWLTVQAPHIVSGGTAPSRCRCSSIFGICVSSICSTPFCCYIKPL